VNHTNTSCYGAYFDVIQFNKAKKPIEVDGLVEIIPQEGIVLIRGSFLIKIDCKERPG